MLFSDLKISTSKNFSSDGDCKNADLLFRGGFVEKVSSGVFAFLPLGIIVLRKIENIIRQEMDQAGCKEILMPALIPRQNLQKTGRDNVDVIFWPKENTALGFSHEEIVVPLAQNLIKSFRDLPAAFFQIQTKFRQEKRSKSGLLRGQEFIMKDAYSFHSDQKSLEDFYQKMAGAYFRIFEKCGLNVKKIQSGGGDFSEKISHEFSVICEVGEDEIIFCRKCDWGQNSEIFKNQTACPVCGGEISKQKAIEVGNIFDLGQKYSRDFGFELLDQNEKKFFPTVGCYGIGITRVLGTIVEIFNDEFGIVWPKSVAPFLATLVCIGDKNLDLAQELSEKFSEKILFDDRKISPGKKFADADLIGCPLRIVLSEKLSAQNLAEIKFRSSGKIEKVKITEIPKFLETEN